ncbi:hypothetical protein [Celeribacter marinus]|uniref:hypothetical protein n=1 Tax=Celeribacter marinus TaxID=1397108 RepID=UPI00317EDB18
MKHLLLLLALTAPLVACDMFDAPMSGVTAGSDAVQSVATTPEADGHDMTSTTTQTETHTNSHTGQQ